MAGINGTGIAADAAGRGLAVALFEADDLASATSSASSKLIHGGLRYLEHYEFRLVKEALAERGNLAAHAAYCPSDAFSPASPPAPAPGVDDPRGFVSMTIWLNASRYRPAAVSNFHPMMVCSHIWSRALNIGCLGR